MLAAQSSFVESDPSAPNTNLRPVTTGYAYPAWQRGQFLTRQTTLPDVSSQNGVGGSSLQQSFDAYGQQTSFTDADGFLHTTQYDTATGAVTGTTTAVGDGTTLSTQTKVDDLGRPLQATDPMGNVTSLTYDDAAAYRRVTIHPATGPAQIVYTNVAHGYTETRTEQDGLQTLSRLYTDLGGRPVFSDRYVSFSGNGFAYQENSPTPFGKVNENYYRTEYHYDAAGRQNWTRDAGGTITQTNIDALGRPVSVQVGTSDSNLFTVAENQYDFSGVGDGNLTRQTQHLGLGLPDRITQMRYDWRDRLTATETGAGDPNTPHTPITFLQWDNRGQQTGSFVYDGAAFNIDSVDPSSPAPVDDPALRGETQTQYDDLGRPFSTAVIAFDPVANDDGTIDTDAQGVPLSYHRGGTLTTQVFHDGRGDVLASVSPTGLWTKTFYDGAGRMTKKFTTDGKSGNPTQTNGDVILNEQDYQYDANGNVLSVTNKDRFHNASGTAALDSSNSRISSTASRYDAANRVISTTVYGTSNPATSATSTAADGNDPYLRTLYRYNAAGWLDQVTDPRGIVSTRTYDHAGRVTQSVAASVGSSTPGDSTNVTTDYIYDAMDHLVSQSLETPGGNQYTTYVYGITTDVPTSAVHSNNQVIKIYTPGNGVEKIVRDAAGEIVHSSKNDAGGVLYDTYRYDALGRVTGNQVGTDSTSYDNSQPRIETTYDTLGNAVDSTTYTIDPGSTGAAQPSTEDLRAYNGFGQVLTEWQAPQGLVDSATKAVRYEYGSAAQGSRLTAMIYPDGRTLHYNYSGGPGENYAPGLNGRIGRVASVSTDGQTTPLEQYQYLGVWQVVDEARPQTSLDMRYFDPSITSGDPYTGLDAFGRIIDQSWTRTNSTDASVDHFQYAYDADSNVLYKDDRVNPAMSELYTQNGAAAGNFNGSTDGPQAYDRLNRSAYFGRGVLSSSNGGRPNQILNGYLLSAGLDARGEWGALTDGSTHYGKTQSQNFYSSNSPTAGAANPGITADLEGSATRHVAFDLWGRLNSSSLSIPNDPLSGGTGNTMQYAYDAFNRVVEEKLEPNSSGPAKFDRILYYSLDGKVIQEDDATTGQPVYDYVYGANGDLVLRQTKSGPSFGDQVYALQDAQGNVTSLTDDAGSVLERFYYLPGGVARVSFVSPATNSSLRDLESDPLGWQYLYRGQRFNLGDRLYNVQGTGYDPFTRANVAPLTPGSSSVANPAPPPTSGSFYESWVDEIDKGGWGDVVQALFSTSIFGHAWGPSGESKGTLGLYNGDYASGSVLESVDATLGGFMQGAEGARQIVANTFSWGQTDSLGLTDSASYQGWDYDASRVFAHISRSSFMAAGMTAGFNALGEATGLGEVLGAAHRGCLGAPIMYGARAAEVGLSGMALSSGIDHLSSGYAAVSYGHAMGYAEMFDGALDLGFGGMGIRAAMERPTGVCFTAGTSVLKASGRHVIESVRCGQRVLTEQTKAAGDRTDATEVDPATWRLIRLQMPNPDGTHDRLDIELLRPLSWIRATACRAGGSLSLSLPEMQIEGTADVIAIEPCPPIEPGRGRVVTGRFTHLNGFVLQVKLAGLDKPLEPTEQHRIFSEDRNDWIAAKDLRPDERLRTAGRVAVVGSIDRKPGVHRVYNLEVEAEHQYFVSAAQVLAHNAYIDLWGRWRPEVGDQIPHGGNDLSLAVLRERVALGLNRSLANGAVAEYQVGGVVKMTPVMFSNAGPHSENLIEEWLYAEDINPDQVTRWYSEREPCGPDLRRWNCSTNVVPKWSNAVGSFSFEYGDSRLSRQAGNDALLSSLRKIFP